MKLLQKIPATIVLVTLVVLVIPLSNSCAVNSAECKAATDAYEACLDMSEDERAQACKDTAKAEAKAAFPEATENDDWDWAGLGGSVEDEAKIDEIWSRLEACLAGTETCATQKARMEQACNLD